MSGTAAPSAGVAGCGYATSLQHVVAQLERLDLLIRAQVWRARQRNGSDEDGLAAFYIPEGEVDALLERPLGVPSWATLPLPADAREAVQAGLDRMSAEIAGHAETLSLSLGRTLFEYRCLPGRRVIFGQLDVRAPRIGQERNRRG